LQSLHATRSLHYFCSKVRLRAGTIGAGVDGTSDQHYITEMKRWRRRLKAATITDALCRHMHRKLSCATRQVPPSDTLTDDIELTLNHFSETSQSRRPTGHGELCSATTAAARTGTKSSLRPRQWRRTCSY